MALIIIVRQVSILSKLSQMIRIKVNSRVSTEAWQSDGAVE